MVKTLDDIIERNVKIVGVRSTQRNGKENLSIRIMVEGEGLFRLSVSPERGGDLWQSLERLKSTDEL